jgi:enoyl-CoA hydratase
VWLALVLESDIRWSSAAGATQRCVRENRKSGCDVGTSWLLPRVVGAARAQQLMPTGRFIDSAEALRISLVADMVSDEDLLEVAHAKAEEILGSSPLGVSFTKEAMWAELEIPGMQVTIELENRPQVLLGWSDDRVEAPLAVLQKRPPTSRTHESVPDHFVLMRRMETTGSARPQSSPIDVRFGLTSAPERSISSGSGRSSLGSAP